MKSNGSVAILGAGNIGRAIAIGLARAERFAPDNMLLTRRRADALEDLAAQGFRVSCDNRGAVQEATIVIVAVEPRQLDGVLQEIAADLDPQRHVLISVVSGAEIVEIRCQVGKELPVVRAMPNTAIAIGRSMTCLAIDGAEGSELQLAASIFDTVGSTLVIDEELMVPATALCACGVAFFLRVVRAASQGGIEIGFHPKQALMMAAQTAVGAAGLVLERESHPEREIDSVTTPRGCTISGLNEMEHVGLSSAMIRGIIKSATKAESLYGNKKST